MINLLPPQEKKLIQEKQREKIIILSAFLVMLFLICLALLLLTVRFYLSGQVVFYQTLVQASQEQLRQSETKLIQERIKELNRDIKRALEIYQKRIQLTSGLQTISHALPEGVFLTALTYESKEQSFTLSGQAPLRETIVKMKENLTQVKEFSEIYLPPSNWLKPANIDFYIEFKYLPRD